MGRIVRQPVLALLVALGLAAGLGLAFLSHAPNRLVSGSGIALSHVLGGWHGLVLLPAAWLVSAAFLPVTRTRLAWAAAAAAMCLVGWVWLAGSHASAKSLTAPALSRTSLGAGFWVLATLSALALADALQRLRLRPVPQALVWVAALLPLAALAAFGALDQLSLLKEYANRQDVFAAAVLRHLQIVGVSMACTLLIGVPLGAAVHRNARASRPLFAALNVIQTVPSIALFGLLMAPLAWLAVAVPPLGRSGVSGIGLAPAVIALVLYSLLPIVRSVASGLGQVPASVLEAAVGMGFTRRQRFWKIAVPLALPALLAGLRVSTVQAIGLAVVAALIGAGGLGAIMFQGLLGSALDLVLLGVLPVVALAVVADAAFSVLVAAVSP